MNRGFPAFHDVKDANTNRTQHVGDYRAVAAPPHGFRAHDRRPGSVGNIDQLEETQREFLTRDMVGIPAERIVSPD
jgi:hypothetical protein